MKTTLFPRVFWIVIVSIVISGAVQSLAAPTRLVEIQEQPSVIRADNAHRLPSISRLALQTPVADTQPEASPSNADELMQLERLGEFKIGSSAARTLELLGNPQTKSKNVFSEADGLYRQSWYYPKQGITFQMVMENKKEKPKIASIRLTPPSTLETDHGIKLGDSYDKVVHAYGRYKDPENSVPFKRFVAGSIYGGLIFSFQNGRVVEIFLGAAAE
jgi:hypothetical protein